jgi:hypothetical protein
VYLHKYRSCPTLKARPDDDNKMVIFMNMFMIDAEYEFTIIDGSYFYSFINIPVIVPSRLSHWLLWRSVSDTGSGETAFYLLEVEIQIGGHVVQCKVYSTRQYTCWCGDQDGQNNKVSHVKYQGT